MEKMVLGVATRLWEGATDCVASWQESASRIYPEFFAVNMDVMPAYEHIYVHTSEPIIAFIHDDVVISEKDWDLRVLRQFDDPSVGLVGFGGALRLGHPSLYRVPYQLQQLARFDFMSNMKNAEDHGVRFDGECNVATLDGFAMFVRRSMLEKIGGWPVGTPCGYFNYDNAIACYVRRLGMKTRFVGVACEHIGGRTANMVQVKDSHADAHTWLYNEFGDVLPFEATND